MAVVVGKEISLGEAPTDGISSLRFSPHGPLLVAASWDTYARIYDTSTNVVKAKYQHKAPVLDAAFISETQVVSGGLDHAVKVFDIPTGRETVLGAHSGPIRCVEHAPEQSAILTGSWDGSVRVWDPRKPGAEVLKMAAGNKVYSMSLAVRSAVLVVATAERAIKFFDLRKGAEGREALVKSRESSLKHQTRVVRAFTDGTGYIVGSIEGRCAVDLVDDDEHKAKKYAFKCHRVPDSTRPGEDRIFPVNAVAFHPVFGTFVTGGGDGSVLSWDWKAKKRLAKLRECDTSVSSLCFNKDGTKLAIAVSYTWEQGERPHPADQIVIRDVADEHVRSRAP